MDSFRAWDATSAARDVAGPAPGGPAPMADRAARIPEPLGGRVGKIRARDTRAVRFGDDDIDLVAVEQVLDASHAWTLGQALRFLYEQAIDGSRSMRQLLDALDAILDDEGLEVLSPFDHPPGDLIRPRRHEVAAALNRLRRLRLRLRQA